MNETVTIGRVMAESILSALLEASVLGDARLRKNANELAEKLLRALHPDLREANHG